MPSAVAVVIPHFQRKEGVLRGAVASALAQKDAGEFPILVVDDESPVPARHELAGIVGAARDRIRIIEQRNSGPGAARNNGLAHVPAGTRYVAFLDSDDQWLDRHVQRALAALDAGFDFYFSDFYFPDYKKETAFNRAGRIRPDDHRRVAGLDDVHEFQGDLFHQVMTGNVVGTSTVVYRHEKFPDLRFREAFFNGQDYLFWLDFARLSRRVAFSSRVECDYGLGVNIYSGTGWGTEKSLYRLHNEIKLWRAVNGFYPLTPEQRAHNDRRIAYLREQFVIDVLHRLRRGETVDRAVLGRHLRVDPLSFLAFVPVTLKVALSRLR